MHQKTNLLWTVRLARYEKEEAPVLLHLDWTWYNSYWINNACKHHVQEHSQAENGENWPGPTYKKGLWHFFHSKIFSDAFVWPAKLVNKKSCQTEGFLCWHLYLCDIWWVLFNLNRISVVFTTLCTKMWSVWYTHGLPSKQFLSKILEKESQNLEVGFVTTLWRVKLWLGIYKHS